MIYAVAGFAVVAGALLARRLASVWRRESSRIDQLLADFDAEKPRRSDDRTDQIASRAE